MRGTFVLKNEYRTFPSFKSLEGILKRTEKVNGKVFVNNSTSCFPILFPLCCLMGYSLKRRAAITGKAITCFKLLVSYKIWYQTIPLIELKRLVPKSDKVQKFPGKLWLCAVMGARLLGRVPD